MWLKHSNTAGSRLSDGESVEQLQIGSPAMTRHGHKMIHNRSGGPGQMAGQMSGNESPYVQSPRMNRSNSIRLVLIHWQGIKFSLPAWTVSVSLLFSFSSVNLVTLEQLLEREDISKVTIEFQHTINIFASHLKNVHRIIITINNQKQFKFFKPLTCILHVACIVSK